MRAGGALIVALGVVLGPAGLGIAGFDLVGRVLVDLGCPRAAHAAETFARPAHGFSARDAFDFETDGVGIGGLATTREGHLVLYVNGVLQVEDPEGPRILATFDPPVYGSFVVLSPDGESVVLGESTSWNIFRVPLAGGKPVVIDNLQFAYDLVFDGAGRGLVSALRNNPANEVVLLDGAPDEINRALITEIPGVSGPIALDDEGNLYYGTVDFSGEVVRQSLHRFTREQVDAATVGDPIPFTAGETILEGMDGFYDFAWHGGKLYFSELGFKSGVGTVQVVDPAQNYLVTTLAAFPRESGVLSPTWLAFRGGTAGFEPGSGAAGGHLAVAYSDYTTVLRIAEITPQLWFVRGETNGDDDVDISDPIGLLSFLFIGGPAPATPEAADANADGEVDISDAVYVLDYLFNGGPIIPPPFPEPGPAPEGPAP